MPSTLINVRLDEERLRKVRRLRAHGISMSDVVREAIDKRFETLETPARAVDAAAIAARIYERFPEPVGLRPRPLVDLHDRHAMRAAILRAMKRKRR